MWVKRQVFRMQFGTVLVKKSGRVAGAGSSQQPVGQVYSAKHGFPPTEQAHSTGGQLLVTLRNEHCPLVQLAFLAIVMAHKPYSWVGNIKNKSAFEMSYIQRNCLPMHHLMRMVHKFHLISGTI